MNNLDKTHAAAEKLSESSTPGEIREVLALFKGAAWPGEFKGAPGTIAWLMADYLPRWLETNPAALTRYDTGLAIDAVARLVQDSKPNIYRLLLHKLQDAYKR